jgi:GntR family transcriptional repressor for pyruvate dehydrogenase complex
MVARGQGEKGKARHRGGAAASESGANSQTAPEVRTFAIEGVKRMIEEGDLPNGSRLPSERELAHRLNVSRPSLREALLALELMGYIEIEQRRGIFVRAPSPDGRASTPPDWTRTPMLAFDFLEVREELETRNAALAAERATEDELGGLLHCCEAHERYIEEGAPRMFAGETDFHLGIAQATHNQAQVLLFRTVYDAVHDLMVAVRSSRPARPGLAETIARDHRAILEAIGARDQELAVSLMREHMRYADIALKAHFGLLDQDL